MGFRFSKRSMDRARAVDPLLMAVAVIALNRCAVDFGITEEQSRSLNEQAEKVRRGVSRTMNSAHSRRPPDRPEDQQPTRKGTDRCGLFDP